MTFFVWEVSCISHTNSVSILLLPYVYSFNCLCYILCLQNCSVLLFLMTERSSHSVYCIDEVSYAVYVRMYVQCVFVQVNAVE